MVADLRELAALTSDAGGAQRVAWTPTWLAAREWLRERLAACGIAIEHDAAANGWALLPGHPGTPTLALGSHLDSVPDGGWLDGALGVVAALELLRSARRAGLARGDAGARRLGRRGGRALRPQPARLLRGVRPARRRGGRRAARRRRRALR